MFPVLLSSSCNTAKTAMGCKWAILLHHGNPSALNCDLKIKWVPFGFSLRAVVESLCRIQNHLRSINIVEYHNLYHVCTYMKTNTYVIIYIHVHMYIYIYIHVDIQTIKWLFSIPLVRFFQSHSNHSELLSWRWSALQPSNQSIPASGRIPEVAIKAFTLHLSCWWKKSEMSPVEVGSLSHYLHGFSLSQGVSLISEPSTVPSHSSSLQKNVCCHFRFYRETLDLSRNRSPPVHDRSLPITRWWRFEIQRYLQLHYAHVLFVAAHGFSLYANKSLQILMSFGHYQSNFNSLRPVAVPSAATSTPSQSPV